MKKIILVVALFASAVVVNAQPTPGQSAAPQPMQAQSKQAKDPKTRATHLTKKMTKHLGLTDDVKAKIFDVNLSTIQKIHDIEAKNSGDTKAIGQEKRKVRLEREAQFKTLLSADQYAKWGQFKKNHRKKGKQGNPGTNNPKPAEKLNEDDLNDGTDQQN